MEAEVEVALKPTASKSLQCADRNIVWDISVIISDITVAFSVQTITKNVKTVIFSVIIAIFVDDSATMVDGGFKIARSGSQEKCIMHPGIRETWR